MDIEVSSYSMVICIVFAGVQIERELLRDTGSIFGNTSNVLERWDGCETLLLWQAFIAETKEFKAEKLWRAMTGIFQIFDRYKARLYVKNEPRRAKNGGPLTNMCFLFDGICDIWKHYCNTLILVTFYD